MSSDERRDRPLCFVMMPSGRKAGGGAPAVDPGAVYAELIEPAIRKAGLRPVRAAAQTDSGSIPRPVLEHLLLCEYAVVDVTTANAEVYYSLGVRHATRPRSTVLTFAEGLRRPLDPEPTTALPYSIDRFGAPRKARASALALTRLLLEAQEQHPADAVLELAASPAPPEISRLRTDLFRERVEGSHRAKTEVARARQEGVERIRAVEERLGVLDDIEAGILVDLLLSYRAVSAWADMIRLAEAMPRPVARTVLVREQYAFALNRTGQGKAAERVLLALLHSRGASSETYGILGRVYKDRWRTALDEGRSSDAERLLQKAVRAYLKGFETDWRDAYPGINAATLMEVTEPPDPRRKEILPVVMYAVQRRLRTGEPDYWDHATLLELAVLGRDRDLAKKALGKALATVRESWELETTLGNLRLIRRARRRRNREEPWFARIEQALEKAQRTA